MDLNPREIYEQSQNPIWAEHRRANEATSFRDVRRSFRALDFALVKRSETPEEYWEALRGNFMQIGPDSSERNGDLFYLFRYVCRLYGYGVESVQGLPATTATPDEPQQTSQVVGGETMESAPEMPAGGTMVLESVGPEGERVVHGPMPYDAPLPPIEYTGPVLKWRRSPEFPFVDGPVQHYPGDVGLDLILAVDAFCKPYEVTDIPIGIQFSLPEGSWMLVIGRSSTERQSHVRVVTGIIDGGYQGDMYAGVVPLGPNPVQLTAGMRIAQALLLPKAWMPVVVEHNQVFPQTERGNKGFGSTGGQ